MTECYRCLDGLDREKETATQLATAEPGDLLGKDIGGRGLSGRGPVKNDICDKIWQLE